MSSASPFETDEAPASASATSWHGSRRAGSSKAVAKPKLNKFGKPWQSMRGEAKVYLHSEIVYAPTPGSMKQCFPEAGEGSYKWFRQQCQDADIGVAYRERSFQKLLTDTTQVTKASKQNFLILKGPPKTSVRLLAALFQQLDAKGFSAAEARQAISTQCNENDIVLLAPKEESEDASAPTVATTSTTTAAASSSSTAASASLQETTPASGRTFAEPTSSQPPEHTTTTTTETNATDAASNTAEAATAKEAASSSSQSQPETTAPPSASASKFKRFLGFCSDAYQALGDATLLSYDASIADIRSAMETRLKELTASPTLSEAGNPSCKVCFLVASMGRDASLKLSLATNLLLNAENSRWVSFYVLAYGMATEFYADLLFQLEWVRDITTIFCKLVLI